MKRGWLIGIVGILLLNIAAGWLHVRWDLTADKRYTLGEPTKTLVANLEDEAHIYLLLTGDMNSGFLRLRNAAQELLDELSYHGRLQTEICEWEEISHRVPSLSNIITPTTIHEREQNGKTSQIDLYPYALVEYQGRWAVAPLLKNNRMLSGEENLNLSIQNLEFAFAEALRHVQQREAGKIAFLEGHGELPEPYVYDIQQQFNRYWQIDRGVIGTDPDILDDYQAIVIADPQEPFSETDKFILDQYLMKGGRILWCVNGVRFSQDYLSSAGYTPAIPLDLNLQDMLFTYGIRIEPVLVQDVQCLPIPVNVAAEGEQPNWQPMPWYYAPLLLTSQTSPITKDVMQVSVQFASGISWVNEEDDLDKEVLLATSSGSRLIRTPAEVDLSDLQPDLSTFQYAFFPVGVRMEGTFRSHWQHRMVPEGIDEHTTIRKQSVSTKQILIAAGNVARNEIQDNQVLPCGFDRYSGMQFGNRDFLVNALLYLTDDEGLIQLRERTVALRLLNDKRAHEIRTKIQMICAILPLLLLLLTGIIYYSAHKHKYSR